MTTVSRGDLLKLDAYRSLELEGAFAPSRLNFLLSAVVYQLALLITAKGVKYEDIEESILEGGLKMKKKPKRTAREVLEERSRQTAASFQAFVDFAKKCQLKKASQERKDGNANHPRDTRRHHSGVQKPQRPQKPS